MERLQKVIANRGYTSRRKAEELILEGKVTVDGVIIKELGTKIPEDADIVINNKHLHEETKEYFLLNKPRGYISAVSDDKGRKVIIDLIETKNRIFPIGRLDYDTTGLIILTNDGDLANILMHPKNGVEKVYLAKIEGNLTMDELFKLKGGVNIDGVLCRPTKVKIKKSDKVKENDLVEVTIEEGRNHIVKKLFKEVNHEVMKLTRLRYGFLEIDNLKSGDYRYLTNEEVRKLYSYKKK
jgi:23S rRNA pseudouridine2605 synthase